MDHIHSVTRNPLIILLGVVFLSFSCSRNPPDANLHETSNVRSLDSLLYRDTLSLYDKSNYLFQRGEYFLTKNKDSSLYYHEQALALRERAANHKEDLVTSYLKVGGFYLNEIKYDVADKLYEKARLISDSLKTNSDVLITLYFKSAECKENLLDLVSANSLLQKNIEHIQVNFPKNKAMLHRGYYLLAANYYYLKRYTESITYLMKAIELLNNNDFEDLGKDLNLMAINYRFQKNYEKAFYFFNKSIAYRVKWAGKDSDPVAIAYLPKAFAYLEVGEKDSALLYLKKNLTIRRKIYGDKNINTFGAKFSMGEFYYREGKYDSAVHYYHDCLTSLIKKFNNPNIETNPVPGITEYNTDLIIGLVGKAKALDKLSENDSIEQKNLLNLSLSTYLKADSIFSVYRLSLLNDDTQLRQLEKTYIPYDRIVDVCMRLNNITNDDVRYVQIAFGMMERSRATILQSSINKAERYGRAGISLTLKQKENEIFKKRAEVIQLLTLPALTPEKADSLNGVLLGVNNEFTKWQIEIQRSNPEYFNLKYNARAIAVSELKQFAEKRNSILLEYLWSDQVIYVLVGSLDSVYLQRIPQTEELKAAIKIFSNELQINDEDIVSSQRFHQFCRSSNMIFKYLVEPFIKNVNEKGIIISANGPLALIPFEALTTSLVSGDEINYQLPYLIVNNPISYTYSSGLLVEQSETLRTGKRLLALGFAGNTTGGDTRSGLNNLPGTEMEIEAIKEVMNNNSNEYLLEMDATESAFKQRAEKFDIIHLAMHGIGDTLDALKSRLIFRSENDMIDDGQLFAHELYDLDLSGVDMAVLSACESGIGKVQRGEGVMSIARGFAYAGCPSMVISLWRINDKATSKVMANFYKYISEGEMVHHSLALSKREYLESANEFKSHPAYWSAFMLVGDIRALDEAKTNWSIWLIAVLLLIILTVYLFRFYQSGKFR